MTPFGVDFPRFVPHCLTHPPHRTLFLTRTPTHTYSWAEVGSPLEVPASFLPPARKDSLHIDDDLLLVDSGVGGGARGEAAAAAVIIAQETLRYEALGFAYFEVAILQHDADPFFLTHSSPHGPKPAPILPRPCPSPCRLPPTTDICWLTRDTGQGRGPRAEVETSMSGSLQGASGALVGGLACAHSRLP